MDKTIEQCHEILDKTPDDWDTRLILADLFYKSGDADSACFQRWLIANKYAPTNFRRQWEWIGISPEEVAKTKWYSCFIPVQLSHELVLVTQPGNDRLSDSGGSISYKSRQEAEKALMDVAMCEPRSTFDLVATSVCWPIWKEILENPHDDGLRLKLADALEGTDAHGWSKKIRRQSSVELHEKSYGQSFCTWRGFLYKVELGIDAWFRYYEPATRHTPIGEVVLKDRECFRDGFHGPGDEKYWNLIKTTDMDYEKIFRHLWPNIRFDFSQVDEEFDDNDRTRKHLQRKKSSAV